MLPSRTSGTCGPPLHTPRVTREQVQWHFTKLLIKILDASCHHQGEGARDSIRRPGVRCHANHSQLAKSKLKKQPGYSFLLLTGVWLLKSFQQDSDSYNYFIMCLAWACQVQHKISTTKTFSGTQEFQEYFQQRNRGQTLLIRNLLYWMLLIFGQTFGEWATLVPVISWWWIVTKFFFLYTRDSMAQTTKLLWYCFCTSRESKNARVYILYNSSGTKVLEV